MPELPDVEVFRDDWAAAAAGRTVRATRVPRPDLLDGLTPQSLGRCLAGRPVADTRRHGKYLFARAGKGWLVLHFGMSGWVRHLQAAERPAHAVVELMLDDGSRLAVCSVRALGRIGWCDDPGGFTTTHGLGIDALDPALDAEHFKALAREARGMVKCWLMDQGRIAGLGNVYSDEILFQAGVHPRARVDALSEATLHALHGTLRRVLETTIDRKSVV